MTSRTSPRKAPTGKYRSSVRRPKKAGNGWVVWAIGFFVVVPLLGFGLKLMGKSQDDGEVLRQAHALIAHAANYSQNASYYDGLVDRFHPQAFESAYHIGGRHRSNSLNENDYLKSLFTAMRVQAEADGKKEVQETLAVVVLNLDR